MGIMQWIGKKIEESEIKQDLMTKGEMMYHKQEELTGKEDPLVKKGYNRAMKKHLKDIEFKKKAQRDSIKTDVDLKKAKVEEVKAKTKAKKQTKARPKSKVVTATTEKKKEDFFPKMEDYFD